MKKIIATTNAPKAIGPYSQGSVVGNLVITSGQIPLHPETMEMPEGITAQAELVLSNLLGVLEAGGATKATVVKCTVFLKDMNDFNAVNEVYTKFFEGYDYPARTCIEVARIPKDALVEIEAIATVAE